MISRRHYLAGTWAVLAGGTLTAVVRPFSDDATASPLQDDFWYRGHRITVSLHERETHIRVDQVKTVHLHRGGPNGGYLTHALPYAEFTSPQDLVRAVVDAEDAGLLVV